MSETNEQCNFDDAPSFMEFMKSPKGKTIPEKMLVQAIGVICVQDKYSHMTPEEVYQMLLIQTELVWNIVDEMFN